jgi:hypothetical protein
MNMFSKRLVVTVIALLFMAAPLSISPSTAQIDEPCSGANINKVVEKSDQFDFHVEYQFQFSEKAKMYCVKVVNRGEINASSGFSAKVDGVGIEVNRTNLQPGQSVFLTQNIRGYMDVKRNNHTIELGAFQKFTQYNFTHKLNASSPKVPSPFIRDVKVVRDEQNDSTSLRVTTFNPGKRAYSMYVQVETFGTDGRYTIAAPQPNQTDVETIQLDESSDEVVAGKVRIFDEWAESDGKFDQKEFIAKPSEDTNAWDDNFEQVPGTVDEYTYSNESAEQYREDYVDEDVLSPPEKRAGAVLSVLLLVGAVLWWRR